jgi:alpha-1,2-mannosyltransferase
MSAAARVSLGRGRLLSTAALVAVAGVLLVALVGAVGADRLAYDFRTGYMPAAELVRTGGSPYDSSGPLPYVYPPLLAELLVPFTLLPIDAASFVAFLASVAAVFGALALVGVRDARCYAAVVLWAPGWNAFEMGNVTAALTLAAALVWRYRDRGWPSASALGVSLATKLFFAPLVVWAAATRRARLGRQAVAIAVGLMLVSWAAIGFTDLTSFPNQIREVQFDESYSLVGMAQALGFDPLLGRLAMMLAGAVLLLGVVVLGRRGDEARAFACAIIATLALSPVVWMHYLVLLSVPLAICRPRFSSIWLVPIVLWVCPRAGNGDGVQPFLPALVALLLLAAILDRPVAHTSTEEALA